jgi:hypothetical protein
MQQLVLHCLTRCGEYSCSLSERDRETNRVLQFYPKTPLFHNTHSIPVVSRLTVKKINTHATRKSSDGLRMRIWLIEKFKSSFKRERASHPYLQIMNHSLTHELPVLLIPLVLPSLNIGSISHM